MFKKLRNKILGGIRTELDVTKNGDYLFMQGFQHTAIRYWKYFAEGHDLLGAVENTIVKVSAVYFFLNLTNIWLGVGAGLAWSFISFIMGWYKNHHMAKVLEEINLKMASHYGKKSYQAGQDTPELLRQILDELKKK